MLCGHLSGNVVRFFGCYQGFFWMFSVTGNAVWVLRGGMSDMQIVRLVVWGIQSNVMYVGVHRKVWELCEVLGGHLSDKVTCSFGRY